MLNLLVVWFTDILTYIAQARVSTVYDILKVPNKIVVNNKLFVLDVFNRIIRLDFSCEIICTADDSHEISSLFSSKKKKKKKIIFRLVSCCCDWLFNLNIFARC